MEKNLKTEYERLSGYLKNKHTRFLFLYILFSGLKSLLTGLIFLLWIEILFFLFKFEFTNSFRITYLSFFTGFFLFLHMLNLKKKISFLSGTGEEMRNALEIVNSQHPWESHELKIVYLKRVLSLLLPERDFAKRLLRPFYIFLTFLISCGIYFSFSFIKIEKRYFLSPEIFKEAILKITPPPYTKLEGYETRTTSGRFKILKGSNVEIYATLIKTKGAPSFRLCEEKIPFEKTGDKYQISFPMERECEFEVQIENRFSIRHHSPFYFELERDEYPEVELSYPREDIVMKSGERDIEVQFSASDDYGISSIQLVYSVSGSEFRINYEKPLQNTKRKDGKFLLETSKFPEDVDIYLYVEVKDNDYVSGPKISRSKSINIHIIGESSAREQKFKDIRNLYEKTIKLLARAIGYYAQKVQKEKLIKEITIIKKEAEAIKKDLEGMGFSKFLTSFLISLPERLENLKKAVASFMRKEAVSEAEEIVYKLTEELKLQTISDAYATAEKIKKLVEMAKSALNEGKKELAEILTKKAEQEMKKLKELISQLPSEIITEFINPDALQAMESMKEKSPDEYIQSLEELIKNLENAGRTVAMGGNPEFFKNLKEAKEKISSLIEKETQLKNKTEGAISQCRGNSPSEDFDELMKRTEKVLKSSKERLKRALKNPETLKEVLRDYKLAFEAGKREYAEFYLREFERMSNNLGQYEKEFYELARKANELRERISKSGRVYEEIPMDEAQKLGDEQKNIRAETEELLEKMGGVIPSLREAKRHMEDAEGMLRGKLMENAMESEEKAINSLKSAENETSQRLSEIEEGWKGIARFLKEGEGMGNRLSAERVEIPKKEETFLNELRREVLEILKKGLPEIHEDENRRYYEEIIK